MKTLSHPYHPTDIEFTDYMANTMSLPALLSSFTFGTLVIFCLTAAGLNVLRPTLTRRDKVLAGWFVYTGCIHFFFEGYFVFNHQRMPGMMDLFGQLWKEYAQADSRYLTSEPFVLCMEAITAFAWGPLSFLTAWMIVVRSPCRYPTQLLVSMGQLYGDILYYATSMMDEYHHAVSYSRPEAYYYFGYFIFMNSFWIVIPAYCMYQSYSELVELLDRVQVPTRRKAS
ncbi:hypothetical protein N7539_007970 [Penicillium diatomitis]|uniref:EXPERA domain-containing protein n=1 Tax=Penicillium diatomitis TaxID=2819901 RepID=A0A9W9WUG0_9EURO|nr:uncharacterized protein N7539_007970 [Penicillium diatomitis]KAJ5475683.1 hypothetical protein N7539_007970 [Penicillium diatomitis]